MKIRIGKYLLENDTECKCTCEGWEIFSNTVKRLSIMPETIHRAAGLPVRADWGFDESIIVTDR